MGGGELASGLGITNGFAGRAPEQTQRQDSVVPCSCKPKQSPDQEGQVAADPMEKKTCEDSGRLSEMRPRRPISVMTMGRWPFHQVPLFRNRALRHLSGICRALPHT
jgi:hypothetical protein